MPALVVLLRGGTGSRVAAGGGYLLFVLAPMWWTPWSGHSGQLGFHGLLTLIANCFLISGLAFIAYMAVRTYLPRSPEPVELCPNLRVPCWTRRPFDPAARSRSPKPRLDGTPLRRRRSLHDPTSTGAVHVHDS
jgi:hypothetical protein